MSNGNNTSTKKLHDAVINENIYGICSILHAGKADLDAGIEGHYGEIRVSDDKIETENTPLHMMTEKGVLLVVLILIYYKANVNVRNSAGNTPLHIAARKGWESITWYLVMNGANTIVPNNNDQKPSDVAREYGNTNTIVG